MDRFDEPTLRKLEQLTLAVSTVRAGVMKGERRSRRRGTSVEFADYRNYARGDDLRRLDWNVFARLERPFIKLLEEEEDLAVHLLIDGSGSMDWPAEEDRNNKYTYAVRLAAALSYVGLVTGDRVTVSIVAVGAERVWGPHRGRQGMMRLLQFLDDSGPGGVTDLNNTLRHYALRNQRVGLLFLLTDLLSPAGYETGLTALAGRGYEIVVFHLLSPDEIDPPLGGDVKLVDIETGAEVELSLDATIVARYRRRLQAWQGEVAAFCLKRQIHYIPIVTDLPWEKLVLQTLRARGVVK